MGPSVDVDELVQWTLLAAARRAMCLVSNYFGPPVRIVETRDEAGQHSTGLIGDHRFDLFVAEEAGGALPRDAGVQRDLIKLVQGLRPEVTERAAEHLPTFDRPVLIVWATRDPLFPLKHAHRLADTFPNAQLETVDGSHAFISLDQPRWLAEQITNFIAALGR